MKQRADKLKGKGNKTDKGEKIHKQKMTVTVEHIQRKDKKKSREH